MVQILATCPDSVDIFQASHDFMCDKITIVPDYEMGLP